MNSDSICDSAGSAPSINLFKRRKSETVETPNEDDEAPKPVATGALPEAEVLL